MTRRAVRPVQRGFLPARSAPCARCPFRRESVPGYLGAGSPESFVDCVQRGDPLPCHLTVDYDDPSWKRRWSAQAVGSGEICSGSLVFMANRLQLSQTPGFPRAPADRVAVFGNAIEFVRHHREAAIRSWDDDDQDRGAQLQRKLIASAAVATGDPIVDFKNRRK